MKVHHSLRINWRGAGPCSAPGDKVSRCPHFWLKETAFLQPPWPSLLLKGRLEQSLIREGRGCERNSQEQPWGKVLFSPQWIHTTIPLSYLTEPESPSRWEKLPINFGILPTRLPRWRHGKQLTCQQERKMRGFHPWVGKIPLEKEMATHSNILAWKIPWTEEPGGLQSMGSQSQTQLSRHACCPQACRPQISWTWRWFLFTSPLTPQKTVHKVSTPFLNNYDKTSIFPKNWTI